MPDVKQIRNTINKELDTYVPLLVISSDKSPFYYIKDGLEMSFEELCKARQEWVEGDYVNSFCDFLKETKDEKSKKQ